MAGAQVRVEETEGPRRAFDGVTDAEGIARFPGVSAGPLAVRARKDLVAGRGSALGAGEGFRVDAVVVLAQTAEVTGVVRQPSDGTGLGGVNVLVDAGPWKGILGAATTDAEGRFLVEGLPGGDGTVYRIRAEDPRTLRGGSSPVFVLSAGEVKEFDVTLRGIGSVTGVLRTFDGTRTLAGAEVDVSSHAEDGTRQSHASRLDGRGRAIPCRRSSRGNDPRSRPRSAVGPLGPRDRVARRRGRDADARPLGLADGPRVGEVPSGRSGDPLPAGGLAPEVRLEAGATRETRLSAEYDFAEVDATEPLLLQASERVEPFHGGLLRGRAVAGQTVVANVRYAPFGTLRVRVVKPDPDHHGLFLPAPGIVVLSCGEPYEHRFPCGAPVRTDAAGNATLPNVGGGAPGRLVATEEATGASGASGVAPFAADGETRDVTVVVEPRGLVRGRLLLPAGAGPAGDASVVLQQQDLRGFWITVASTVSGGDGRFELRDVGFGSLVLRAATTTGPLARAEMALPLSAATPVVDTGDLLLDGERPRVVSVTPSDGATGVGLTPVLEAVFSEPLGAALHGRRPQEFVELSGPYGIVPVTVTLDAGDTALRIALTNGASLAGATTYQLRILGSLPDRSGLTLGGDVVVRFTTADLTAPTVLTSAPLPGQIQVATDVNPVVVFTKALDAATVASGVRLERRDAPQGPAACAPALRADGRTVALNPGSPLAEEADYEIVVDGVADTAGNRLPSTVRIPFLTRDDHAPVVTLDVPATSTPLEGSLQAFTLRFVDDDVARVRLTIVAATGSTTCGENDPGPSVRAVSFSCRLPRISAAGGTSVVVRAEGSDRSGNSALPSDRALTLAPDAPPVLDGDEPRRAERGSSRERRSASSGASRRTTAPSP